MRDRLEGQPGLGILAFAGGVVLLVIVLIFSGGHTATVLSTVGAAIPDRPGEGAQVAPPVAPAPAATSAATAGGPEIASADGALAPAPGLLIVHTGLLRIRVDEIAAALDRVSAIVTTAGGYVATSKTAGTGSTATATLELRVPAAAWDRTLTEVRAIGAIIGQEIGSDEVTGQVLDLDARVANLRATEAALQAIMVKATRIPDILEVQEQLTTTRGEIEQLTAKAAALRDRAAYGSLALELSLPATVTPAPVASRPPIWDPGRDAEQATGTLVRVGQVGTTAGIWVAIVAVPVALAILIGLGILRLAWLGAKRVRLATSRDSA
jgi:hypothetical protein